MDDGRSEEDVDGRRRSVEDGRSEEGVDDRKEGQWMMEIVCACVDDQKRR